VAAIASPIIARNFICSPSIGKITLVLIGGEQGTYIRDETTTNAAISDYQNRHHFTVTLVEYTIYIINIQLDCPRQYNNEPVESDCSLAHRVDVWIDLNNDGRFDESENRVHQRQLIDREVQEYTYDLQILIPSIDGTNTKAGPHRMRLRLTRSEIYQRQCGNNDYGETREYTVNIIPRKRCEGKICPLIHCSNLSRN
jgi:hypothetical protein